MNLETLPHRIPASVVCKLAGYGKNTLRSRITKGQMPRPIDRAKENIFHRDEVLKKLGLAKESVSSNPFEQALDELEKA